MQYKFLMNKGELVESLLGAHLLNNTNDHVEKNDSKNSMLGYVSIMKTRTASTNFTILKNGNVFYKKKAGNELFDSSLILFFPLAGFFRCHVLVGISRFMRSLCQTSHNFLIIFSQLLIVLI